MTKSNSRASGGARERRRDVTMAAMDLSTNDLRYEAIRRRDPRADDRFFYSVVTTGVYCRPSCAARLAKPENVGYHASPDDAERAGYRPCKRCRPRERSRRDVQATLVDEACRALEQADELPSLAALAARAGLSPFYFHRLFKERTGMTPRAYASACRLRSAEQTLRGGASVTTAIHEAGYGSSSRFYERASATLGMTPSQLRRGGEGVSMRVVVRPCSLGRVLVAATERGVAAIAFGDDPERLRADLRARFPRATIADDEDRALDPVAERVVAMIDRPDVAPDLPLDLIGTAFQQKVWRALREIPPGTTVSYGELARRIDAPRAVRAVGTACGQNPVAVAVPCNRVLREDGSLGGYRWGLERKRKLLAREQES